MRGAAALLLALGAATAARAQTPPDSVRAGQPRFAIDLPDSAGARAPVVRAGGRLGGPFLGALRNGFPVRFAFRLQLWRDARLFDRLEREETWDAVVVLDPLTGAFELLRTGGSAETFQDPAALERALATPFTVDLLPPRDPAGRGQTWYYVALLEIESLSISELDEVERWLRGDLGPAISQRDVGSALSRGARLAMIRLSGLPRQRFEARSRSFRY